MMCWREWRGVRKGSPGALAEALAEVLAEGPGGVGCDRVQQKVIALRPVAGTHYRIKER